MYLLKVSFYLPSASGISYHWTPWICVTDHNTENKQRDKKLIGFGLERLHGPPSQCTAIQSLHRLQLIPPYSINRDLGQFHWARDGPLRFSMSQIFRDSCSVSSDVSWGLTRRQIQPLCSCHCFCLYFPYTLPLPLSLPLSPSPWCQCLSGD